MKEKFNQTFDEVEIEEMKKHIEEYKNSDPLEEFKLPSSYYMTIMRKVVFLSDILNKE